jgi:hypothetical protein
MRVAGAIKKFGAERDPNNQSDFLTHEIRTESNCPFGSLSLERISRIAFA